MPEVILPRLLLKGQTGSSLTTNPGSITSILTSISSQLNIPKEIFLKKDNTLSGGIALFCHGAAIVDPEHILQENDVLEIVMALSGG